ncbi:hypothetical protein BU23DRAFT_558803 [Bimuria novae-zelandiae CBS 107.79]|uniref:TPR-like protein n=1 Tax=Bimuria novae-zelandiae CBS 107.79 TaxID=1447943 RepID=A0A6A5UUN6_9PLEO|nr:hypothetical protein BU23DRAFT_558803 [Bimuria novae-zelandiae CBS 107.79]
MLHSSFWHHGASELPLPVWWASPPALDHATGDHENDRSKSATRPPEAPLLDFLYPEKTLAFIRRLSAYGVDAADLRRRAMFGAGARQYSTSQWSPPGEGEGDHLDDLEAIRAKEEMDELLLHSTADDALRQLLWSNPAGKQELAWHLYSALTEPAPSVDFLCDTLDYLGDSDLTRTANRVLQVFDRIPPEKRRSSSYRIAVTAYVALKMVGPAIQLLEQASERFDPSRAGIDAVLKRTIQDDQWDLSLRVFKMFLKSADRNQLNLEAWRAFDHDRHWGPIFGQAREVLEPVEHLRNFLDHVEQFNHELNATKFDQRALRFFAQGYVPGVMSEVLNTPDPNEDYIYEFFSNLFRDIRARGIPTWTLYDYIIPAFLRMPRYRAYTHRRKIFLDLYMGWRQEHLDGHCNPPSRRVIYNLITQHGRHMSYNRVNAMVEDLRTFHPQDTFKLPIIRYLLRFYAKNGMVDRAQEFFQILQTGYPTVIDVRDLSLLTYAYARRVDVPGAIHQFKRITDEFNLVPDTGCWNTLLYAFTRADDLDGALECFNNCLESGVKPDLQTFGPILDLCAGRGDVEAFEALFSRAKQLNVPVETDRRARSGYVQVFLAAGDPEGAEQIALGILHSWQAGTFVNEQVTHVWNMLISHHAVARNLADSRRIYNQMVANKIPLNSWTYAALMRSMVESGLTSAAYKILRVTMPAHDIRVHAFHYSLVIGGYLRENQIQRARRVYHRMKAVRVNPTPASRQQELLYKGMQDLLNLREEKNKDPRALLVGVEEQLRRSLLSDYGQEIANDEPKFNRYIDSPELNNVPQGYFAIVVMLYTARGAYDIAKELIAKANKAQANEQNYSAPIALLTAAIEAQGRAGDHEEVERSWELVRTEANRLVKAFYQVMHPEPPKPEFDSIVDPVLKERFEAARIATNRRQILFRATRVYIRSLCAQDTPEALQRAQRTLHSLLSNGFVVDNLTWNEFIQHLAIRDRIIDAFTACEMYLMPSFPGWASLSPVYIQHYRRGYNWMELRHYEVKRTSIIPRYKTLVVLAAAHAKVVRDEMEGVGFNPELGGWAKDVLEQVAPLTIRAIETMPRTGDPLQRRYLSAL